MENNNNVNVTTNENKEVEKKPSVFKSICSFVGFIAGAWLFIMCITGGFDNEYEKLQSGDIKGAVDTFVEEDVPVLNSSKRQKSVSGYKPEIIRNGSGYDLYVEPYDTSVDPYEIEVDEWMVGKTCYMMDNYVIDYGNMSVSEIYELIYYAHYSYINGYNYFDLRGIDAIENLNGLMRENDYQMEIILEGQILNVEGEGNVIQIFDLSTTEENLYKYENNDFTADLNCLVDISMVDNKDEFFVNDFVTIYARYCGRIPTQNGSYQPLIVAVAMELQ